MNLDKNLKVNAMVRSLHISRKLKVKYTNQWSGDLKVGP